MAFFLSLNKESNSEFSKVEHKTEKSRSIIYSLCNFLWKKLGIHFSLNLEFASLETMLWK